MMKNAWIRNFRIILLLAGTIFGLYSGFADRADARVAAAPIDSDDIPYNSCKDQNMAQARQTLDRMVGGKVVEGPEVSVPNFSQAEQDCVHDLDLVPPTSILMRGFQTLQDWNKAAEFSIKVGKRLSEKLDRNEKFIQEQINCLKDLKSFNEKPSNPACVGHVSYFKNAILDANFESRLYQVFAVKDPAANENDKKHGINFSMANPPLSALEVQRDPLAEGKDYNEKKVIIKEYDRVRTRLADGYVKELQKKIAELKEQNKDGKHFGIARAIEAKTADLENFERIKKEGLDPLFEKHNPRSWADYEAYEFDKYRKANFVAFTEKLNEFPVLRFVKQADPKPADLAAALGELVKIHEKKKADVAEKVEKLEKSRGNKAEFGESTFRAMNGLVQYPKLTDEVLKDDPSNCSIAVALSWHEENREAPANIAQASLAVAGLAAMFGVAPEVVVAAMASRAGMVAFAALDLVYLHQFKSGRDELRSDVLSVTSTTDWGQEGEFVSPTGSTIKDVNKASADFTNFLISAPASYLGVEGMLSKQAKNIKAAKKAVGITN